MTGPGPVAVRGISPVCILRCMRRRGTSERMLRPESRAPVSGRPAGCRLSGSCHDRSCLMLVRRLLPPGMVLLVLASLISGSGCSTAVRLPPEEMRTGAVHDRSRVFTRGGREFRFDRVTFRPDSLVGEYRVLLETGTEGGTVRYEEAYRAYPVALGEVDSVLVQVRSFRRGIVYGAGIGAAAGLIYFLLSEDDDTAETGGGKPDPPAPLW